jgi:hypothetical protein
MKGMFKLNLFRNSAFLWACVLVIGTMMILPRPVAAELKTRIVVLPFYVEEGRDAAAGQSALHYRRMMGFIQNRLVQNGFEVIDAFAKDQADKEYNRVMETAREDSALACQEMCRKYGVDAAYIVWLKVNLTHTPDDYYKAAALADGSGYDSGGRSLGANLYETFKVTRRDADEAIGEVEKEVGDLIGRKLTEWNAGRRSDAVVEVSPAAGTDAQGRLAEGIQRQENDINIRLDGATEHALIEVFGKVLNSVRGVTQAKLYSSNLVPDNPQACHSEWEVEIADTEPFRLQSNIMKMVNDIIDAGGTVTINGVPYRYNENEVMLLKGLRTGSVSTREIQFVIDRDRARDKDFTEKSE